MTVSGTSNSYSLHGADLVMSCKYDGDIEPNSMLWYHDGSTDALTETNDVVIVNGCYNHNILRSTLMIKSPTFSSDNGPYTCSVSVSGANTLNHVVSSSVRTARISDGSSASVSQVTVTSSELVVTCVVEGEVAPSFVNWLKVNGNTLQPIAVEGEINANMYKVGWVGVTVDTFSENGTVLSYKLTECNHMGIFGSFVLLMHIFTNFIVLHKV